MIDKMKTVTCFDCGRMIKDDRRFTGKIDWDKLGPCCTCVNGVPCDGRSSYQMIRCKLDGKKRAEHLVMGCWRGEMS